jgi:hypothetical protein
MSTHIPNAARPKLSLKLKPTAPARSASTAESEALASILLTTSRSPPEPPPEPDAAARCQASFDAAAAWVRSTWPAIFAEPIRPLAVGAGMLIANARPPGMPRKAVKRVLSRHAGSDAYLAAIRDGVRRIGLAGEDAGEPEERHRAYAQRRLDGAALRRSVRSLELRRSVRSLEV